MLRRQPQREQPSRRKCQTFTRRAKAGLGDSHLEMLCLLAASDYYSSGVNIPPVPQYLISMATTRAGVKYQPLEGRPLPGASCYGNISPFLSFSPSWLLLRDEVGVKTWLNQWDQETPGKQLGAPEAPGSPGRPHIGSPSFPLS